MHQTFYYFGAAGLLLLLAMVSIWAWDRGSHTQSRAPGDGSSEGAFRGFYHALWALLLWSGFALFVPLWLSFRSKLGGLESTHSRGIAVMKVLSISALFLLVLLYGRRRGYLNWIEGLEWPDKENK